MDENWDTRGRRPEQLAPNSRLCQDEPGRGAQGLSKALASKPEARRVVREATAAEPDTTQPPSAAVDAIREAQQCIRDEAAALLECHTTFDDYGALQWGDEEEAEGAYNEMLAKADALDGVIAALDTQAQQIEAMREDAERLDWLEKQDLNDLATIRQTNGVIGINVGHGPRYGKTLRAAIDSAMAALEDQGP